VRRLVDLQPATVGETRFIGARVARPERLAAGLHVGLAVDERRRAERSELSIGRADLDRLGRQIVQALVFRVAQHQVVRRVPQDEGFRDRFDRLAQPLIGGRRLFGLALLVADVDGDADQPPSAGRRVGDQLGALAQPDPFAVAVAHPQLEIDRRGTFFQRARCDRASGSSSDEPSLQFRRATTGGFGGRPSISNIDFDQAMRPWARKKVPVHRPAAPRLSARSTWARIVASARARACERRACSAKALVEPINAKEGGAQQQDHDQRRAPQGATPLRPARRRRPGWARRAGGEPRQLRRVGAVHPEPPALSAENGERRVRAEQGFRAPRRSPARVRRTRASPRHCVGSNRKRDGLRSGLAASTAPPALRPAPARATPPARAFKARRQRRGEDVRDCAPLQRACVPAPREMLER